MIGPSTVFRKTTQQVSCQINDEVAILDLERSLYFGLEGAGVQIWEALEQPRSVAELRDYLVAEFDVAPADCEADIVQMLSSLKEEGLVEVVG
jgi:Coenzyme PQQ synthesis protein D (PqqD)